MPASNLSVQYSQLLNTLNTMKTPTYTELADLASERLGGKILFTTDDWFAVAENLLKVEDAEWRETEFTEFGKWMDGWETRRKRIPGHDWCVIQLGVPGVISGIEVDTGFFSGNYSPRMSVQAAALTQSFPARSEDRMGTKASQEELDAIAQLKSEAWQTVVPMTDLGSGVAESRHNYFSISNDEMVTHIRLNMFPDGGIGRLRVYGTVRKDWSTVSSDEMVDLVAMENGGTCEKYSDAHYGHPRNLLVLTRAKIMADGWETARRLDRPPILEADENGVLKVPGCEWAEFKLGHPGTVKKIEIDTNHFKGNFPDSCCIEGCYSTSSDSTWKRLLPVKKLQADYQHYYEGEEVQDIGVISHVRVTMAPDGGISRVRLHGYIDKKAN